MLRSASTARVKILSVALSGPSVIPQGDMTVERPVLVAVHGGPGLDHMTVKSALEPLAADFQVLYFDLRGHGRSDRSSAESWNMRIWADDLRRLCDALGLRKPVILGSSFGGDVALTYAALFPDHPGGVILANTTGGHRDWPRVIEAFGRVGGPEAAAIIERIYAADGEDLQAEFNRVCYPLYSATPGWAEESRRFLARMIRNPDVAAHYNSNEVPSFDPWSLLGAVRCRPGPRRRGRPGLPAARGRGTSQPAAGRHHSPRATSRGASHHLPRPPGPRLPRRQDLCRPDRGKPPCQLSRAARPGRLGHSQRGPANCADPATTFSPAANGIPTLPGPTSQTPLLQAKPDASMAGGTRRGGGGGGGAEACCGK